MQRSLATRQSKFGYTQTVEAAAGRRFGVFFAVPQRHAAIRQPVDAGLAAAQVILQQQRQLDPIPICRASRQPGALRPGDQAVQVFRQRRPHPAQHGQRTSPQTVSLLLRQQPGAAQQAQPLGQRARCVQRLQAARQDGLRLRAHFLAQLAVHFGQPWAGQVERVQRAEAPAGGLQISERKKEVHGQGGQKRFSHGFSGLSGFYHLEPPASTLFYLIGSDPIAAVFSRQPVPVLQVPARGRYILQGGPPGRALRRHLWPRQRRTPRHRRYA